ncbi:hypothetical protein PR048_030818 [Dryococelus australis]|uniref:Uncharacterized protein n=1 Tax=Dryococelus australis TaxID=614101 RepID=A0ABQ9GCJ3_9NEOP|nr:hypothetical protein PR048_030818 [Dryococelus australis]
MASVTAWASPCCGACLNAPANIQRERGNGSKEPPRQPGHEPQDQFVNRVIYKVTSIRGSEGVKVGSCHITQTTGQDGPADGGFVPRSRDNIKPSATNVANTLRKLHHVMFIVALQIPLTAMLITLSDCLSEDPHQDEALKMQLDGPLVTFRLNTQPPSTCNTATPVMDSRPGTGEIQTLLLLVSISMPSGNAVVQQSLSQNYSPPVNANRCGHLDFCMSETRDLLAGIVKSSHTSQQYYTTSFTNHDSWRLRHDLQTLNFTVLYALEPAPFLHWLLHRYEATPFLTELHVIGAHNCAVFIYWCTVTQDVPDTLCSNDKRCLIEQSRGRTQARLQSSYNISKDSLGVMIRLFSQLESRSASRLNESVATVILTGARSTTSELTPARMDEYVTNTVAVTMCFAPASAATELAANTHVETYSYSPFTDKFDFKRVYTEVTFAIGSGFIMHALDDSEPIADLQGNKKRIPCCEWLDNPPPTKRNRVRFPVRSLPDFCIWESCRTMPLVGGFFRVSPVSPAFPFRRRSILAFPNLFTRSLALTQKDMIDCKSFYTIKDIRLGQYQLGSPLVDDLPIMNAVKYMVVSGVVWTNRTMMSPNTATNRTGVHAVYSLTFPSSRRFALIGSLDPDVMSRPDLFTHSLKHYLPPTELFSHCSTPVRGMSEFPQPTNRTRVHVTTTRRRENSK